jgi:DNA-binding PadR family transcriptional regulator
MPSQGFHRHRNNQASGCGHGRGRRGAGRRRDAAGLRLATLAVLADQPGNGLAVISALAAQGFCQAAADASTVYPTLSLLTDMGMVSATTEPAGQTVYAVLDEGAAVLASNRPLIDAILAETALGKGRSREGRKAGRRRRHCCGQRAAPETAPTA